LPPRPSLSPDETAAKKVPYGGERFFAFRHVEDVREVMVEHGDEDKRIAILEFGWTTDDRPDSPYYWHGAGAGIDEATKGKYLVRASEWADQNWQPWIGLMTVDLHARPSRGPRTPSSTTGRSSAPATPTCSCGMLM
jgi:polysaccharide biosynthesis protein PslG